MVILSINFKSNEYKELQLWKHVCETMLNIISDQGNAN